MSIQWHAYGHMLACLIAQEHLKENNTHALEWSEKLLGVLKQFSKSKDFVFIEACVWADDIKQNWLDLFSPMHYADHQITTDGSPLKDYIDKTNSISALQSAMRTLMNKWDGFDDKGFSKSMMLYLLMHVVGDVHQPLHNATLVTKDFPKGDKGGNLFLVQFQKRTKTDMHSLWDSGFFSFP